LLQRLCEAKTIDGPKKSQTLIHARASSDFASVSTLSGGECHGRPTMAPEGADKSVAMRGVARKAWQLVPLMSPRFAEAGGSCQLG
jgi:hypothetical protein